MAIKKKTTKKPKQENLFYLRIIILSAFPPNFLKFKQAWGVSVLVARNKSFTFPCLHIYSL